jgi:hypothetical protein
VRQFVPGVLLLLIIGAGCNDGESSDTSPTSSSTATTSTSSAALPAAVASAVAADVGDGALCAGATNPEPERAQVVTEVASLKLIAVPCETFAYNVSYQLAIYDGSLHAVTVPVFDADTSVVIDRQYLLSAGLEPTTTGEFKIASKGRGVGGCGDAATYRLQVRDVVLLAARSYECPTAGPDILDPDDWPVVYTAP